jgi:hypothetical protein
MVVSVTGRLAIKRSQNDYSPILVREAEAAGIQLPSIPKTLSDRAYMKLLEITSPLHGFFFVSTTHTWSSVTAEEIVVNDGLGPKSTFEEQLLAIRALAAEDGCTTEGQFILTGDAHNDIFRWTLLPEDATIHEERIRLVWPDGQEHRYSQPRRGSY